MSTESVMPSNHLILCRPLLLPPSILPSIRVFSNESVLHIRWPKYWSFSFSISLSNEYSRRISFWMHWLDLPAVQGTFKSLLQHHSSKASILWCSACFFGPTLTSIHDYWKNHSFDQMDLCWLFAALRTVAHQAPWDLTGKNTGVGCHVSSKGSSQPRYQTHISCIPPIPCHVKATINLSPGAFGHDHYAYFTFPNRGISTASNSHKTQAAMSLLFSCIVPSWNVSSHPIQLACTHSSL